jgi:hypothetical protein
MHLAATIGELAEIGRDRAIRSDSQETSRRLAASFSPEPALDCPAFDEIGAIAEHKVCNPSQDRCAARPVEAPHRTTATYRSTAIHRAMSGRLDDHEQRIG